MLSLSDPLWRKLDDAHRDRDIPKLLIELADRWDEEAANSLFWDCLCHQETCYGATYAVVPHLLEIARSDENVFQRCEIAIFLGFVALCAFDHRAQSRGGVDEETLAGLPETLEEWDRKLDPFRGLVAMLEAPDRAATPYERDELLPSYRKVLETDAVTASDLEKIRAIKLEFLEAFPAIREVCRCAFIEQLHDEHAPRYLLSGVAAADGLFDLARLLHDGSEGIFECAFCGREYEFMLFDDRVAYYASEDPSGRLTVQPGGEKDRRFSDYKDGAPNRADGFLSPLEEGASVSDHRVAALLDLATRASVPQLTLLLRNYLGTVDCRNCGVARKIRSF